MKGFELHKTGSRVNELLERQFVVPTLGSEPNEQTRNWIDGKYLVEFRIGEFCRVKVGEEWMFYRLVDIVNDLRVWQKANSSEITDMSNYYTREEIDNKFEAFRPDKNDIMAIELSTDGEMILLYGEETSLSDGYINDDGELILEFNYE